MVLLRRLDGAPLAGGISLDIQTHGLEVTAKRAARQAASPDGSVSPPRSPKRSSPERSDGTSASFFLPTVMSPQVAEHQATVATRLSSGENVRRRQRESTAARIRHMRSRSLSPRRPGQTVSPQGRLAREVARRAEEEALRRSQEVVLSPEERATQAAIKRLSDKTAAMELASEAMRHQLAVAAEIMKARDAPKTHTVSSEHFQSRVAALQAARLAADEVPEALQPADARLSWPRRSPSPQDCISAIDRGERSARLQQWRSQLLRTPLESTVDERAIRLEAALAAIPVELRRRDQKLKSDTAVARTTREGGAFSVADATGAQRDYIAMDWLNLVGKARLVSPERRGVGTRSTTSRNASGAKGRA